MSISSIGLHGLMLEIIKFCLLVWIYLIYFLTNLFFGLLLFTLELFIQFSEAVSLSDDRVHLITLERKTPLGTRHASKKFDLYVSVLRSLA